LIMEKVERAKQMLEAQRAKSHRLYAWLVLKSGNEDHAVHFNKQQTGGLPDGLSLCG
jgi:hypothetical protein